MRGLLPAVVFAILLAACGSDDGGAQGPTLEGTTWVLDDASMGSLVEAVPSEARIDLTLEAGQAQGTSACNTYSGSYTLDGDQLTFGPFAATQMACDQPLMDLEAAYLAALGDVSSYAIDAEGTLVLSGGDMSISYTEEVPPEPLPLTGTEWRLTTIASETAVSSTIAGTEITASFGEDGTVEGSDGCNRYNAGYEVADGTLTFGPLATTKMACEPDVQQQATRFAAALEATAAYEIEGTSLTLLDEAGSPLLVFDGSG